MPSSLMVRKGKRTRALEGGEQATNERAEAEGRRGGANSCGYHLA
jgi:hypothetical protein